MHYGKSSVSLSYLCVKLFKVFDVNFGVCEHVDVECLFLFGDTSSTSLEIKYFLHVNAKLFDALSMVTTTNFWWSSSRSFLTPGSLITGFVCLALTFCFHGLEFEVVYLVLSVITLIHVSRAVVISIDVLEEFIVGSFL